MKLDDTQKKTVAQWIEEGLKLAEIQKRLGTEFGISMTYMDVRLLVDDLKLMPKDPEPPKQPEKPAAPPSPAAAAGLPPQPGEAPLPDLGAPAGGGSISVTVDAVTRPGSMVSGNVTFTDGESAVWYLDQMGRLGLAAKTQGYRPSAADIESFQLALQKEMEKLGL
ncbi:MAG: hypothetical protein JWM16_3610 [Verrucomicrobiales bacterium]|nr:hypothetical protein [Verrucomicrobiales bacterium]